MKLIGNLLKPSQSIDDISHCYRLMSVNCKSTDEQVKLIKRNDQYSLRSTFIRCLLFIIRLPELENLKTSTKQSIDRFEKITGHFMAVLSGTQVRDHLRFVFSSFDCQPFLYCLYVNI